MNSSLRRSPSGDLAVWRVALLILFAVVALSSAEGGIPKDVRLYEYEGRLITAVELVFEGSPADADSQAELLSLLKVAANTEFSAVRVRDSLQVL
ncbi:MAG TPA: hypothetical protein VF074_15445, partial [Pyrinomonadaceae bacterium]